MALEQTGSRAVLFGVHAYQHLSALDGVRHNVPALRDRLTAQEAGGFAGEHCVAVPANSAPQAFLDAVQEAADHARGLLLVYYAGHGHFGRDGRALLLGTQASRPDRPHHSVPYEEIRAIVAGSRARHRVVVVDCCFSGAALHMNGQDDDRSRPEFDIDGACVLTSSAETERSLCLRDGSVFTRELVLLLRDGLTGELPGGRRGEDLPVLTIADVYDVLRERLKGRTVEGHRVPAPRMSTRDSGHRIPLAANRAHTSHASSPPLAGSAAPVPGSSAKAHTAYAATRYFTGREDELTALTWAAEQPAAVCVVHGRGGQGKTELLRSAAARMGHRFPGGCLEIDLRGWTPGEQPRDPHMVIAEQLHHMGYGPERIPADLTARTETWRLQLVQHPVLLLLDNAYDATQLAPLLPSAGSPSVVMISSRSELPEISAHLRCELRPLSTEDCVTVWHKMGISQDVGDLGQLADRINGSPLALGPVGTRLLRGAHPTAILASLASPDRYTAFPSLDAAERDAFNSAYTALDTDLRNLIHHCAWHPGPDFAPDSLAAMAQRPEHEVEVRLTEIEQILIRKNNRYSLHDSSLAYARQTAARHCTQDEEQSSRSRLYHHLRTRLRYARDTLDTSGSQEEREARIARKWLDTHTQELQSAAHASNTDKWQDAAEFLNAVGTALCLDHRYIEAEGIFRTVLSITVPGSLDQANANRTVGDIYLVQGRYDDATTGFRDALAIYQAIGSRHGQADATQGLGEIHRLQDRHVEATTAFRGALTIYQALGNRHGQADATRGLGCIHVSQGRYDDATTAFRDALTTYQALGNRHGQADAIYSLGEAHLPQGRYDDATTAFRDALAICQALGNRHGQANATRGLGDVHRLQGRYDDATTAFHDALAIYQALGNRHGQADAIRGLGDVHRLQGRYDDATTAFRDALAIYQAIGSRHGQADAIYSLGEAHLPQGRYDDATTAFRDALAIYQALGSRHGQADAIRGLGDVHRLQGHYGEAIGGIQKARDLYIELGVTEWADRCQLAAIKIEAARVE
ncbi:caspase, EACC1-associated type [Streptomyces sp. NPDC054794]